MDAAGLSLGKQQQLQQLLQQHPYYPPAVAIPGYTPNASPVLQLISLFGAIVAVIIVVAYKAASRPGSRFIDRFAAAWFGLCSFLHITFEGYYILHRTDVAAKNTLYAQLWKEYTLSDSRYLTLDVFTVCVETITVFAWGPLSLLTVVAIILGWNTRHGLQIVVCIAHLYGVALYYSTNWLEGVSYSRPEFLYYWVYYVGFNMPWAVVPFWLLWDSFSEMHRAFEALKEKEGQLKAR